QNMLVGQGGDEAHVQLDLLDRETNVVVTLGSLDGAVEEVLCTPEVTLNGDATDGVWEDVRGMEGRDQVGDVRGAKGRWSLVHTPLVLKYTTSPLANRLLAGEGFEGEPPEGHDERGRELPETLMQVALPGVHLAARDERELVRVRARATLDYVVEVDLAPAPA